MNPILAIDPGVSGGIAFCDDEGIAYAKKMPKTGGDCYDFFLSLKASVDKDITCYLERVGGFMAVRDGEGGERNSASAHTMFAFGFNYGFLQGLLHAMNIPVVLVGPQNWQSTLNLPKKGSIPKGEWKNYLKSEAQRRYPGIKVTLNTADALLILSYGKMDQKMERAV